MKSWFLNVAITGLIWSAMAAQASAADVVVKGLHLCCGGCVTAVKEALEEVKGISKVAGDPNTKIVSFQATDAKAAEAGVKALAEAGFYGSATFDKKELKVQLSEVDKKTEVDQVKVSALHLCCGQCKKDLQKALKDVPGVAQIEIDGDAKTAVVSGSRINVAKVIDAMHAGGYHGSVDLKK